MQKRLGPRSGGLELQPTLKFLEESCWLDCLLTNVYKIEKQSLEENVVSVPVEALSRVKGASVIC